MMDYSDRIIIGSDHAAFRLKEIIKKHIEGIGYDIYDAGCNKEESCDYPIIGHEVTRIVKKENCRGILMCGTGLGMSFVANRRPGIRAALCHNEYTAEMSKMHNNANILILGSRVVAESMAIKIVDIWFNTEFEGGRHQRRIDQIDIL
ncbi:MAG: ribose 5-phosphate isomerase B [Spirochaetota bacterium]|nr:ribose 5-phosphate isomerase B [Spirochaetota bacterium]